jgi:hypothetical protein
MEGYRAILAMVVVGARAGSIIRCNRVEGKFNNYHKTIHDEFSKVPIPKLAQYQTKIVVLLLPSLKCLDVPKLPLPQLSPPLVHQPASCPLCVPHGLVSVSFDWVGTPILHLTMTRSAYFSDKVGGKLPC